MFTIKSAALAAVAGLVMSPLATAPSADATTLARGEVIASKLTVRTAPTSLSSSDGWWNKGQGFWIVCKVKGQDVGGNRLWYKVAADEEMWVAARYVKNVGKAPRYCTGAKKLAVAKTTTALNERTGPNLRNQALTTYQKGSRIGVVCKVRSQNVKGNSLWYYTEDGTWVSARYAANVGAAPKYCG